MRIRKVLAVTGIRSDYEVLVPVLSAINSHKGLDLQIVVSGAHLSNSFGLTVEEIEKDGFEIVDRIESLLSSDTLESRARGLGIQLLGLVQTVSRVRPDFLLVLGDREEAISTALVGAYMNIPVAHVCGGDRVVGNVDDQIRHAASALSSIHFTSNKESAERLIRMGEQPFRVFNFGNPGIDKLVSEPHLTKQEISKMLNFDLGDDPFLVILQHVISSESDFAYSQMKTTLQAIKNLGLKTIIIFPNSDAGGWELIKVIEEYEDTPSFKVAKNLPRNLFINLLRHANCLVGNSSAGIMEAPALKLPVVNIGNRQKGRLHAENVQFVQHDEHQICSAVTKAVFDQDYIDSLESCSNPYGSGQAAKLIADKLATIELTNELLIKDLTF
jgi:GDP/UDP-N,N'-diacetylbacillosamine 2-epimerase (hydrolysing)